MSEQTKFNSCEVLANNPGRCAECGKSVRSILLKQADGRGKWTCVDALPSGYVEHVCDGAGSRKAA